MTRTAWKESGDDRKVTSAEAVESAVVTMEEILPTENLLLRAREEEERSSVDSVLYEAPASDARIHCQGMMWYEDGSDL